MEIGHGIKGKTPPKTPPADNTAKNTTTRFWRIAFKITDLSFNFSQYERISPLTTGLQLFTDPENLGYVFYDLCRRHQQHKAFHPDFTQSYFCSLFRNTSFPCNVFVFIEALDMRQGKFVSPPHNITMSAANLNPQEKKAQLAAFAAQEARLNGKRNLPPTTMWNEFLKLIGFDPEEMAYEKKFKLSNNDQCVITPDFELFYIETPQLSIKSGSDNELFLNLTSQFLRGSSNIHGSALLRPNCFACFTDSRGMEFMRCLGFKGLVPNMTKANTLIPLIMLICEALGYKYSFNRINRMLAQTMKQKLLLGTRRLRRRPKHHINSMSAVYQQVELYLTQTYLRTHLDYHNRLALDLHKTLMVSLEINEDYHRINAQLQPMQQLIQQLSTQEIIKAQGSLRFAIIALGFTMVLAVVAVCLILGIEPMVQLFNELGIPIPSFLEVY